jgi:hypothetical protein
LWTNLSFVSSSVTGNVFVSSRPKKLVKERNTPKLRMGNLAFSTNGGSAWEVRLVKKLLIDGAGAGEGAGVVWIFCVVSTIAIGAESMCVLQNPTTREQRKETTDGNAPKDESHGST